MTTFTAWAIVELMGHRQRAGKVSEETLAGVTLLRIDIPTYGDEGEDLGTVTEYYGGTAIYALRPAAEDVVRAVCRGNGDPRPRAPLTFRQLAHEAEDVEAELDLDA